jgi:hypothetical protein
MIAEHHLRRRGAAMLFRRAVPQNLRKRFEKKEIVKGLGAKTSRTAQYLAQPCGAYAKRFLTPCARTIVDDNLDVDVGVIGMFCVNVTGIRKYYRRKSGFLCVTAVSNSG